MFLHVVEARYVRDYTVWVRFNDGTYGEVDLAHELNGPIFETLRDVSEFKRFQIAGHTIAWENGADLAPEFLRAHTRLTAVRS
jgi:hypothetical protein